MQAELDGMEALLGREGRDRLLAMAIEHGEVSRAALAAAAGDQPRLAAEAHRLRGAAGPFGATGLTALLARVEKGELVAPEVLDAQVRAFLAQCRAALAA